MNIIMFNSCNTNKELYLNVDLISSFSRRNEDSSFIYMSNGDNFTVAHSVEEVFFKLENYKKKKK